MRTAEGLHREHPGLVFLVGGQRGVDTWAAQAATRLGIRYEVLLPLPRLQFTQGWRDEDVAALDRTLADAAAVGVVGGSPDAAYTERNRRLATGADLLVAIWTGRMGGGTAETMRIAREVGTQVREVRLAPSSGAGEARGRGV